MSRLDEFRDMIDSVKDKTVLESGQQLLREIIEVNSLKLKLKSLEDNLTNDGKAIFYFFAMDLDEDEVVFAAERISGKIKRIDRKAANEAKKAAKDANIQDKTEDED